MGCFGGKQVKSEDSTRNNENKNKSESLSNQPDLNSGYLFIIREASANREESAYPSRLQSHT